MGPFESLPRDCASQASQFTQQLACSPEASGEPSAVDTNMPLRENTLLEGLGSQASGSAMPREAISEDCPGDSKRKSTSASQTAPLSSLHSHRVPPQPAVDQGPLIPGLSLQTHVAVGPKEPAPFSPQHPVALGGALQIVLCLHAIPYSAEGGRGSAEFSPAVSRLETDI